MSATNKRLQPARGHNHQRIVEDIALAYASADKRTKGVLLDELCARTGWHRSHARRVLKWTTTPRAVDPQPRSRLKYSPETVELLTWCWKLLDMPTGKRLVPALPTLVDALVRHGHLTAGTATTEQLLSMSSATVDKTLAAERARSIHPNLCPSHALVAADAPIRRLVSQPSAAPGHIEATIHHHGDGSPIVTLTSTATATRWTTYRSFDYRNDDALGAALTSIGHDLPFAIEALTATTSDEQLAERIEHWCVEQNVDFYLRLGTANTPKTDQVHDIPAPTEHCTSGAAIDLLNEIWRARAGLINNFYCRQFDARGTVTTATPWQMVHAHPLIADEDKAIFRDEHTNADPVQLNSCLTALTARYVKLHQAEEMCSPLKATDRSSRLQQPDGADTGAQLAQLRPNFTLTPTSLTGRSRWSCFSGQDGHIA
ncbi:hypothetical protein ACIGKR_30580 [Rhodococcus qingshengii]|uniref:hypothetical protein n=1 Tax=Rhodococcus qingshengii TaxID=334542 RepID=UPI0037C519FB